MEELWRPALDLALHRNRSSKDSRLVQLATIRGDGRPAVRTLVFRGFLEDTHRLTFAIDDRSAKAADMKLSPWVEACWYFPMTCEQFRLGGSVELVATETHEQALGEARENVWRTMSDDSRLSFVWPDPGRPRMPLAPFPTQPPDALKPPAHFCLLLLEVCEVDYLELHGNPQHRWKYSKDARGRWSGEEVNP
jgi:PPOX class probable FMN-dependent enzyme